MTALVFTLVGGIGLFLLGMVLIARVLPEVLAKQRLPKEQVNSKTLWRERFQDIVNLEDHLHRNGTRIIKCFLHVSKEEQRQRFLARIDDPDKKWKLNPSDIEMRGHWDDDQHVYADCLGATSTKHAPWYVVPADDKENARLIISHAIVETMKTLKMSYPEPTEAHRQELKEVRRLLVKEHEE